MNSKCSLRLRRPCDQARISPNRYHVPARASFALACAFFLCALASCAAAQRLPVADIAIATAGGKTVALRVELARTESEQEKGYMGRKEIPDGTGMVFAYQSDRRMNFWMKNTPSALSIAFIDSEGAIREIYDMTPFSLETVSSERSVRYALEVPSGWFGRAGVAVGDRLSAASLAAIAGH